MIPAGFIPRKFREFIYGPMTEQEIKNGMDSMWIYEEGEESRRPVTREEFLRDTKKIIGVRDTRTGEIHYNRGGY